MLSKKRKILITICLSLLIFVALSIPFTISYCSADYIDDFDYQFNISTFVDTTEESFYNSIYSSRIASPGFGDSLRVVQGDFVTDILYQYENRVNNLITFTSSNGGITSIQVTFNDFLYDFNDSTFIFGSVYIENALFVEPIMYAYDVNRGEFSYVSLDLLTSGDGWYALDFNVPQNFVNDNGYTYVMYLSVNISFNTTVSSRTVELDILPNYSYSVRDFFNSLKTVERIEYELNFFESLAQSVDRIMLIEIFPGISFYSLLSVVIAVPIFIAILKLWLGG